MVDINLHQAAEKDLVVNRKKSFLSSTYFISLALLLAVGIAYGLTMSYKNVLIAKKNKLIETKTQEMQSINQDEINRLVDFENRLESSVFNVENKKSPEDIFSTVEKLIVRGASLNKLAYDGVNDKIEIEVVANSFILAANQILSLKKSELFSDVQIVESKRDPSGQAVFNLEAVFNSAK